MTQERIRRKQMIDKINDSMNGMVELDSEVGKLLGFTSDKFEGYLWLELEQKRVLISAIISLDPGKGNLSKLFSKIEGYGLRVAVPTPFACMEAILRRKGFEMKIEHVEVMGDVEVWEKPVETGENK
jgi:hypothetical protein